MSSAVIFLSLATVLGTGTEFNITHITFLKSLLPLPFTLGDCMEEENTNSPDTVGESL